MSAHATLMTVQQFLELPDEELRRHELWQGELIEVGETIFAHNWIRETLRFGIKQFLLARNLGGEVLVETAIQFDSNTLARPDLAYWDAQHLAGINWNHSPLEIVPQLLAEVVSPSNSCARFFETRSITFARACRRYGLCNATRLRSMCSRRAEPSASSVREKCWKLPASCLDFPGTCRISFLR